MKPKFLGLLFVSVFLIFMGRGLQMILWEAPLRTFFWDENLLSPIVENLFNTSWSIYTKSPEVDQWIDRLNDILGILLIIAAISTLLLLANGKRKIYKFLMVVGIIIIGAILILEYKEKFYHFAQFLEGFTQFFVPILLLLYMNKSISIRCLDWGLRIAIGLTFVGHGLYAINVYATPGIFIDMVIVLLGISEDISKQLLWLVGWLDILLLVLLFIPITKKVALYYACIWGTLTALSRFAFHFTLMDFDVQALDGIHLTLYRLPHGLVPLAILFLLNYKQQPTSYEKN